MSSLVAPWPNVAEIPTFPAVSPIDWVTFITGGAVACSWAGIKAILGWIKVYIDVIGQHVSCDIIVLTITLAVLLLFVIYLRVSCR